MSRENKYRAWARRGEWEEDGEKRKFIMIDADSLAFEQYLPLCDLLKDIDDDIYFMEWTGLYDLYEDDIVELGSWQPNRFVIKFIEGAFCLADIATGEHVADIHYIHHAGKVQFKIIGNIHESS